jgi:hypothetical protein
MFEKFLKCATPVALMLLCGCLAAPPTGADFAEVTLAPPPADQALIVVFRDHADPRGIAARIEIGEAEVMRLPEQSFGLALAAPGTQTLRLRWPPASGTPGWEGSGDWTAGATYYYELTGTAGHGFYFRSQLTPLDSRLAELKMRACCWLNTEQKGSEIVRAGRLHRRRRAPAPCPSTV